MHRAPPAARAACPLGVVLGTLSQREFFTDNLLVRIHFIIVMIWWTGLAPWEFEHCPILFGTQSRGHTVPCRMRHSPVYRGTSLIRNRPPPPLGPP